MMSCSAGRRRPVRKRRSCAGRSGSWLSAWPGSMVLVSHDPGFVTELAPDRVLLMPEGVVDYWSDDLLDLVELA